MEIPTGWAQINVVMGGPALPRRAQCVYGAQLVTGSPLVTAQDHANFARDTWEQEIMPLLVSNVILQEVRCKFGPSETGLDATATSNQPGGVSLPSEAPQVALLIRKVTAQGGRSGKGRMFLPGVNEGAVSGGVLDAGSVAVVDAAFEDWLAAHSTAQFPVALLHAEAGISPFIVLEMATQSLVATQRRRIRKVGGRRAAVV